MQLEDYEGEVKALSVVLDMMKEQAENSIAAYKHALNKNPHTENPSRKSFDPAVGSLRLLSYSRHWRAILALLNCFRTLTLESYPCFIS